MKRSCFLFSAVFASNCFSAHGALLIEDFGYANGSIVGASGSPWVTTSGTVGQVDIASGLMNITGAESEDVAAPFSSTVTSGVITATFDVNFSALPTTGGAYFAHFVSTGVTPNFTGRVWSARPTGTAVGAYRLGVSNSTNTATFITVDLATATTYTLTLTLNLATDVATLAINSGLTLLGSASGADATVNVDINRFGFRQASGEGNLQVDNLSIVPEPSGAAILGSIGVLGLLRRRR